MSLKDRRLNDRCSSPRSSRIGFSLIEAAIVLGVLSLVIGAIWAAASSVNQRNFIVNKVNGIYTVNDNIRRIWMGQDVSSTRAVGFDADIFAGTTAFTKKSGVNLKDERGSSAHVRFDSSSIIWDLTFSDIADCMQSITTLTQNSANNTSNGQNLKIIIVNSKQIIKFPATPLASDCVTLSAQVGFRY